MAMANNPYLDQFLMFYSQSDAGNGLTRGLENDLARRTYVPTKLDRELRDAILDCNYRLVILTGNAGDGKTAFIQKLEEAAEAAGAKISRPDSLGSHFEINGRTFRTLYDGSVEVPGTTNQEMLANFFVDFEGDEPSSGNTCLVVAMNEGKLIDFLSHTTHFKWLSQKLLEHLQLNTPLADDMVLVNLNLRSVVDAARGQTDSLFDQILDRYVAEEFWTSCDGCPARHRCPVKFNVDTFRLRSISGLNDKDAEAVEERNASARIARSRLKSIFQILHFRKRIHVTVRDLRSVLAYTLFGKHTCQQIEQEIQSGSTDFTDRYYYNAVFDANEKDRILGLLRDFDVGLASLPMTDSRLSFTRPGTSEFRQLFLRFDHPGTLGRTNSDVEDLCRLYDSRPMSPEQRSQDSLETSRKYVSSLRRKLFFEGDQPDEQGQRKFLSHLLPYDNIEEFMRFIETKTDPSGHLKQWIVLAISRSESIYDEQRGRENICIRTRHDADTAVKAYFTYPAGHFNLEVEEPPAQAKYVEYLPTSVQLRHHERNIVLEISLDLYEMLMRIRDGYVPAAGEMRAFFLNLLMFKKQLMSLPSERLLLSGSDYNLYQMSRTPQNGVSIGVPS
ncbi:hypothetical protein [Gimesia sp.]|uniref:hypothetical protein n=1 Tax=Gimesia sp. TaxID=2024833 RepID=UPI003A8E5D25